MPLFWLSYRHRDGSFAGAVVVESNALINARMRAALAGADKGVTFVSGDVLDEESAGWVPIKLLDRPLSAGSNA